MAALALGRSLPALLPTWTAPAFLSGLSLSMPSLQPLLDLFPPFLLAVPKSKTSHSRKAMRSANKGLKDKQNITNCAGCGGVKLAHHICPNCYSSVTRQWKAKNRQASGDIPDLS